MSLRTRVRRSGNGVVIGCLMLMTGCGQATTSDVLHVFAASSLTEAFQDLERGFEAGHPGVDIRTTFAGSQILGLQIEQGAEADVFASANRLHMQRLLDAGRVFGSRVFAQSALVVVVPPDNPAGISTFRQLAAAERLIIGTENVPVGSYARTMLGRAAVRFGAPFADSVRASVVSEENNVRLVRAKAELGEADAAIVYRTDAAASERVRTVEIPPEVNVAVDYFIAIVADSPRSDLAARWVDYLLSDAGQSVLGARGFLPASADEVG